jgi:hypothetical protein
VPHEKIPDGSPPCNPDTGESRVKPGKIIKPEEKNLLSPYAVISAAEMVLHKKRAGRAEAADLFHVLGIRGSAAAEELGRLVFFERMALVVLADGAVFPADCPVLFRILDNGRFA